MPLDPITTAIVSSVIGTAIESALAPSPPAVGIIRDLPGETQKGVMFPPANGLVKINGKIYLLSPGVLVRDDMNMLVFAENLQQPVKVRFTTDYSGAVQRVWILSAAEASLPENR